MHAVDRLNIVAHDEFQEIIDEANRPDSAIRLQAVVLDTDQLGQKTVTVVSQPQLASRLGFQPSQAMGTGAVPEKSEAPLFTKPEEQKVAQIAYEAIRRLENQPQKLPTAGYLTRPEIQAAVVQEVAAQYRPAQLDDWGRRRAARHRGGRREDGGVGDAADDRYPAHPGGP